MTEFNQQYTEESNQQNYQRFAENIQQLSPFETFHNNLGVHRDEKLYPVVEMFMQHFKVSNEKQKYEEMSLNASTVDPITNDILFKTMKTDNTMNDIDAFQSSEEENMKYVPSLEVENSKIKKLYVNMTGCENVVYEHKENLPMVVDIENKEINTEDEAKNDNEKQTSDFRNKIYFRSKTHEYPQSDSCLDATKAKYKTTAYKRSYQSSSTDKNKETKDSGEMTSPCRIFKYSSLTENDGHIDVYSQNKSDPQIKPVETSEDNFKSIKRNKGSFKYRQFEQEAPDCKDTVNKDRGAKNKFVKRHNYHMFKDSTIESHSDVILDKPKLELFKSTKKEIKNATIFDKDQTKNVVEVIKDNCTKIEKLYINDARNRSPQPSTSTVPDFNAEKNPLKFTKSKSVSKAPAQGTTNKRLKDDKRDVESSKNFNKKPSKQNEIEHDATSHYRKENPRHVRTEAYKKYSLITDKEDKNETVNTVNESQTTKSEDASFSDEDESRKMRKHRMTYKHRYQHQKRVKWKDYRHNKAVAKNKTSKDK